MKKLFFLLAALLASVAVNTMNAEVTPDIKTPRQASAIISFEDPLVEEICVNNWDTDGDQKLSMDEAAAVTSLGMFFYNSQISSFNELQYFTGLTKIEKYAFYGCSSLTAIVLSNSVTSIETFAFAQCSSLTAIIFPNSVTSIGSEAFYNCTGITTITIGSGVTSIGLSAFNKSNLTTITVDSENTTYDSRDNCNAIIETSSNTLIAGCQSTFIPNSVTSIGISAFYNCSGLTSIYIPNNVTSIKDYAFNGCDRLSSLYIGSGLTSIEEMAFAYCPNLISITIDERNTAYDSRNYCNAIIETSSNTLIAGCQSTVIPNSVTSIGEYAFGGCTRLTDVTIPNSVTSIRDNAFRGCSKLTDVTIPNSVTSIGENVFFNCYKLATLTLGSGVSSIGRDAFSGCSRLKTIFSDIKEPFPIHKTVFNIYGGSVYETATLYVPVGSLQKYQTTDAWNSFSHIVELDFNGAISFADNIVKSICISNWDADGDGELSMKEAFAVTSLRMKFYNSQISSFNELQYFTGLTKIESDAFLNCSSLAAITIPNSVTSIGENAFYNCSGLTDLTIPNSVTSIGNFAFSWCSGLTSATIPNSVTSIGEGAFESCTGLTSITVDSGNTIYDSRGLCNAIIETSSNQLIAGCKNTVIPNSVTSIGENAFLNCKGLTDLTIPNSVTSIGNWAFYGCSCLTDLTIGNSVTSIGNKAFYDCSSLTDLTIGNSVTSIGEYAFSNCKGLTDLTIPNSVTSIGVYAFISCTGLTSITVDSGNTIYDSREHCNAIIETSSNQLIAGCKNTVIPNSVTSIGDFAFYCCSGPSSVNIPNSVTSIGNQAFSSCTGLTDLTIGNSVTSIGNFAFSSCSGLTSVTIPSSVTSIGNFAFYWCSGLTSATIPNSVTSIGENAFNGCFNLANIYCEITEPFIIDFSVFESDSYDYSEDYIYENATLYVPVGSLEKYQSTESWSRFAHIEEKDFDQPDGPVVYAETTNMRIGRKFDVPVGFSNGNGTYNGYQFELSLPEGFHLQEQNGQYVYTLSDRFNGDGISVSVREEFPPQKEDTPLMAPGQTATFTTPRTSSLVFYYVKVFSSGDEVIKGNEGELIRLVAVADKDVDRGEHEGHISSAFLTTASGEKESVEPDVFHLVIPEFDLGDVNIDKVVDVTDVMVVVNRILGNEITDYHGEYADLNDDGVVDVTDIMLIVSVILDPESAYSPTVPTREGLSLKTVGDQTMVSVPFASDYTAFQMTVRLTDGMRLIGVAGGDTHTGNYNGDDHQKVLTAQLPDGSWRVVVFSTDGTPLRTSDEGVLRLKTAGCGQVSLSDVLFTTVQCESVTFSDMTTPTGIDDATASSSSDGDVYDLSGRRHTTSPQQSGIYIQQGKAHAVRRK